MGPKMLTEHAQMHAGKCERCKKWEPKEEGEFRNWEGGELNNLIMKSETLNLNN